MKKNAIEVSNIFFTYPDGHKAIDDISFEIQKGESVGLIGHNGAGKSTLLSLLVGLNDLKDGQIKIFDDILNKQSLIKIRKQIGFLFQDPDDQLFMTTVYDDVAFGPVNYGFSEDEVDKKVQDALKTVGIYHLKDKAPYKLSGGEKRLAAIASILSLEPQILLMDEPTTALDPKSRRRFINIINNLPQTKLIASHDLDMILETCSRVLVMRNGKIIKDGKTEEILYDKQLLESCDLELPLSIQKCQNCNSK
ncbi:energy-coupling factor ABC transporter ATP-binding protein [Caldicellulosiruptoraceae bacterium PP1]